MSVARVDLVPNVNGSPLLIELELTEPSIFLATGPHSATNLAEVLADMGANRPEGVD